MFPRIFGGRNKDDLNDDNPSYDNQHIPEHSSVTSHSSTGVMSGDQDVTEPLNMSLNPNNPPQLPPRPGEGGAAGGVQDGAHGGADHVMVTPIMGETASSICRKCGTP